MGSKLVGCGSAVPKLLVSNDDLAQIVETSDEWISVRTGIRSRRVLSGTIFQLCPCSNYVGDLCHLLLNFDEVKY